jgi:hypothetical protein
MPIAIVTTAETNKREPLQRLATKWPYRKDNIKTGRLKRFFICLTLKSSDFSVDCYLFEYQLHIHSFIIKHYGNMLWRVTYRQAIPLCVLRHMVRQFILLKTLQFC